MRKDTSCRSRWRCVPPNGGSEPPSQRIGCLRHARTLELTNGFSASTSTRSRSGLLSPNLVREVSVLPDQLLPALDMDEGRIDLVKHRAGVVDTGRPIEPDRACQQFVDHSCIRRPIHRVGHPATGDDAYELPARLEDGTAAHRTERSAQYLERWVRKCNRIPSVRVDRSHRALGYVHVANAGLR